MTKIHSDFNFDDYTYREFQTFLIMLRHEGNELRTLKKNMKKEFGLESRTKAYDYINSLCKKGVIYKKSNIKNGKRQTKIFVKNEIRRDYEKFIIPTISDTRSATKEFLLDKLKELKRLESVREKLRNYTGLLIEEVKELIRNTSPEIIKKKRFLNTVENRLWTYFNQDMLKYEFFSK